VHETEPTNTNNGEETEGHESETEPRITPRIYVASLSDYNDGRLYGVWLDAAVEAEDLAENVQAMLASPGAEEFAIHDYEGFGPFGLGEYESLEIVSVIARGIAEHGAAFGHFAALMGSSNADTLSSFDDHYEGHFEDLAAYGEYVIEMFDFEGAVDTLPDLLIPYVRIDAEAFARDMEVGGMISTSEGDGGIYVFQEGR
jgi:antirestriction protein